MTEYYTVSLIVDGKQLGAIIPMQAANDGEIMEIAKIMLTELPPPLDITDEGTAVVNVKSTRGKLVGSLDLKQFVKQSEPQKASAPGGG